MTEIEKEKIFEQFNKEISTFINLVIASVKIKKLTIIEPQQKKDIRPQIHLIIMADSGSAKSTILHQIAEITGCNPPIMNMTAAGLIGTVDSSTKQVLPAHAWECRDSIMLIDEFKTSRKENDPIDPQLALFEHGFYSKKFGLLCHTPALKSNGNLFQVSDGRLTIKSRFAAIMATMRMLEHSIKPEVQALVSRCIPYRINPAQMMTIVEKIAEGHQLFTYHQYEVKKEVFIKLEDYKKIVYIVKDMHVDHKVFLRAIGDCCRTFAVLGQHDESLYRLICRLKQKALEENEKYIQVRFKERK